MAMPSEAELQERARRLKLWGLLANWDKLSKQAWVREYLGVEEDERDRIISGIAGRSALFALILVVLASPMIMSGTAVPEGAITREADWLTFYAIACAMFAMSIEAAVTVFHHWRDRR